MHKANAIQSMRESTSIILLVIVIISLLRPVTPFISDGIAHTFYSEQHHLALHQNGCNHLDVELKNLAKASGDENDKLPVSTFSIETVFTFFTESFELNINPHAIKVSFCYPEIALLHRSILPVIQPPDFGCISLL